MGLSNIIFEQRPKGSEEDIRVDKWEKKFQVHAKALRWTKSVSMNSAELEGKWYKVKAKSYSTF